VSVVQETAAVRLRDTAPEGARFRIETRTEISLIAAVAGCALVVLLLAFPFLVSRSVLKSIFFVLTLIALAQYWNLLAGYAGLVSIGQQAYVGFGGYMLFAFGIFADLDPVISIVLAGVVAGVVALPTAFLLFRLRGAYFSIGTWVIAEVFRLGFAQVKSLGGGTGTSLPTSIANDAYSVQAVASVMGVRAAVARDMLAYWLAVILAAGTVLIVYSLLRSRHGLALGAIRDNPSAVGSIGINEAQTKLWVYVLTAVGTGMAGALMFLQTARISPDAAFNVVDFTAFVLFVVIIGGIGTLEGPIVGAILLFLLREELSGFGAWYLLLLGASAIAVMLYFPKGLWGTFAQRFDVHLFPVRRRLVDRDKAKPGGSKTQTLMQTTRQDTKMASVIETDVLIVGSGPAGSSAAALLSMYGIKNMVVTKWNWTCRTPRAHITNQRTMEILRDLGVERQVMLEASPQEIMGNNVFCTSLAGEELGRLQTWGTHPSRKADYDLASPTQMCDMPQNLMEPILVGAAARRGSTICFNWEYLSHTQDAEGVTAEVKDHVSGVIHKVRAKYMIGADGGRSKVAQDIGLPMEGKMGVAGSMNIIIEADLSRYVAHRPSVLYWIMQPGSDVGGIGMGLVRMVRPWYEWLLIWGYDINQGPPQLTDAMATEIAHNLIGDHTIPIKIKSTSIWTVNDMYATSNTVGRVFCMGDAVHRHPPSNGLGSNTSIQDAYNLCWKLAHVLKGKADPSLLETYDVERSPVAKQIVKRANKSITEFGPIFEALGLLSTKDPDQMKRNMEALKENTPVAAERREALRKAIAFKSYEFNCHGVEMNHRYASTAVVGDGTDEPAFTRDAELYYQATTWPGARLPHAWLERDGQKISSLDLVGKGRFTVLTGIGGEAWVEAAEKISAETGVEIAAYVIGPGRDAFDVFGAWAEAREIAESGCLLVRPDMHVGFRAHAVAANATDQLRSALQKILGLANQAPVKAPEPAHAARTAVEASAKEAPRFFSEAAGLLKGNGALSQQPAASSNLSYFSEENSADVVNARIDWKKANPRAAEVACSLVRHLHAFVKEVKPTHEEWLKGIQFLTDTGHMCTDWRQEFILLSDTLGVSMLVDAINHHRPSGATENTILGPFHVANPPRRANGDTICLDGKGEPTVVYGRVFDLNGHPIPGVVVDIWQTNNDGFYDVQQRGVQPDMNMRGVFETDAEGRFWFRSVRPRYYPIPDDGPVGKMLKALGRHPNRAAHIHLIFEKPGFDTVITHIFEPNCPYLREDAVFGAKASLVADFVRVEDRKRASELGFGDAPFFWEVRSDFVLAPARVDALEYIGSEKRMA
jgi:2,4-dichlorophenol 6-monooxygenase